MKYVHLSDDTIYDSLQWRHNEPDALLNHQRFDCLPKPFVQAQLKENIKAPRHWPLCGNLPVTDEIPAQRASSTENVSSWWRFMIIVAGISQTCFRMKCPAWNPKLWTIFRHIYLLSRYLTTVPDWMRHEISHSTASRIGGSFPGRICPGCPSSNQIYDASWFDSLRIREGHVSYAPGDSVHSRKCLHWFP